MRSNTRQTLSSTLTGPALIRTLQTNISAILKRMQCAIIATGTLLDTVLTLKVEIITVG